MSDNVKVLEDVIPQASDMLREVLSLQQELSKCEEVLRPFGPEQKEQYRTLPQYIVKGAAVLKSAVISGFDMNYPVLSSALENGLSADEGMRRLHDGLYRVGQFYNRLCELKFAVKLDTDRESMHDVVKQAVGDLAVYVITQYKLDSLDSGVYLSVSEYCDRSGISPSILYGELLLVMDKVEAQPFGYESISPYRQELLDIDPVFVAECEEQGFPLTAEMSERIVKGELSLNDARATLMEFMQQREEKVVDGMTPANMISRMNLS